MRIDRRSATLLTAAALALSGVATAQELDAASQEALLKTMQLLVSPSQRGVAIEESDKAKEADDVARAVAGTAENTQRLYELAARILENVVTQANGDPEAMFKILEKAQKDPAAFARTFQPDQTRLLQELGREIEASAPARARPGR